MNVQSKYRADDHRRAQQLNDGWAFCENDDSRCNRKDRLQVADDRRPNRTDPRKAEKIKRNCRSESDDGNCHA